MRTIKGILIDPFACTVSEVELDGDSNPAIYALLSHPAHPVDCYEPVQAGVLKKRDTLCVDEEGLYKNPQRWFQLATGHQPFAGKGLILGADDEGDFQSAATTLDMVRMAAMFFEQSVRGTKISFGPLLPEVRLSETRTPFVDRPKRPFEVWYMKPGHFHRGITGQALPNPRALTQTHELLKVLEVDGGLDDVYHAMQGEIWSPNGEARELIASKGLQHTSMSVGDVIVDDVGNAHVVATVGFKAIGGVR